MRACVPKNLDPKGLIDTLESALQLAKNGDLLEVTIIGKKTDGDFLISASGSYNCHEMAGKILDHAILRLGYQPR